jgi:hypothetical protein
MKKADKSVKSNRNLSVFISELSGCGILNLNEMMRVRGGDPDGGGGDPIVIPPKPI